MGGQRRRRLDTRSWREVMLRFGEAGTTVSAFCAREGLSTSIARIVNQNVTAARPSAQRLNRPRALYSVKEAQQRRGREPLHQRRVLHGVPAPVTAELEHPAQADQAPRPIPSERNSQPNTAHFCERWTQSCRRAQAAAC